ARHGGTITAMARRSAVGLGLAAVALVAGIAWWLVREDAGAAPPESTTLAGSSAAELPAALPDAAAPHAAPDPLWHDAASGDAERGAAVSPAVLTSTLVHDDDGSPVPDAIVQVFVVIADAEPQRHEVAEARTGADGSLQVEFEHAVHVWEVRALPGDGHALVELDRDLDLARGATEHIELRAQRGSVVRGVVVDEAGHAVPQAAVLAWSDMRWNLEHGGDVVPEPDARTVCDNAGRFELSGLGPQLVLMPQAPGLAAKTGVSGPVVEGGEVGGITLVLGPAFSLAGRVVDPEGRPVAGVSVKAGHSSYTPIQAGLDPAPPLKVLQRTDPEGRFALAPL